MSAALRHRFRDRSDAGVQLAERLLAGSALDTWNRPIVLALPRGGVPVGFEVARRLGAPLEVFVARKVGAPGQPEYGIGAIAEGDDSVVVVDESSVRRLRITPSELADLVAAERAELARRVEHYRRDRPLPELAGRDVVVVDDGLATGVTAEAAVRALRSKDPARLILAVPACAPESARRLRDLADDVVCTLEPRHFSAVGQWYDDFDATSDGDVLRLLAMAQGRPDPAVRR